MRHPSEAQFARHPNEAGLAVRRAQDAQYKRVLMPQNRPGHLSLPDGERIDVTQQLQQLTASPAQRSRRIQMAERRSRAAGVPVLYGNSPNGMFIEPMAMPRAARKAKQLDMGMQGEPWVGF